VHRRGQARTVKNGSAAERAKDVSCSASHSRWNAAVVPLPGRPCQKQRVCWAPRKVFAGWATLKTVRSCGQPGEAVYRRLPAPAGARRPHEPGAHPKPGQERWRLPGGSCGRPPPRGAQSPLRARRGASPRTHTLLLLGAATHSCTARQSALVRTKQLVGPQTVKRLVLSVMRLAAALRLREEPPRAKVTACLASTAQPRIMQGSASCRSQLLREPASWSPYGAPRRARLPTVDLAACSSRRVAHQGGAHLFANLRKTSERPAQAVAR